MFSQMQIYGAERGLKNTNNSVFGFVNNTYITLTLQNNVILLSLPMINVPASAIKRMKKEWKANIPTVRLTVVKQQQGFFQLGVFAKPKAITNEIIDYLINMTMMIIGEEGGNLNEKCHICHQQTNDFAYNGDKVLAYCNNCQERIEHGIDDESVPPLSYLTGLAGAFVGAFVGMVPYVLVTYFFNTMFSMLAALAAMGSMVMYSSFRGAKISWFAMFSVVLSTLIASFGSIVALFLFSAEIPLSAFSFSYLRYLDGGDILFTLLFSLFGISYAYAHLKQYIKPMKAIPVPAIINKTVL